MNLLSDVLYWLTTGMLVPVVLALLGCFGAVLLAAGDTFALFLARLRAARQVDALMGQAHARAIRDADFGGLLPASPTLRKRLEEAQALGWSELECERIIADLEYNYRKEVETASALLRLGPMLGLMGTLIPMGPALVGLAAGDLGAMATNMQVAFSTTVLGLFVGGAGFLVNLLNRRWYARECQMLDYLFSLAQASGAESRNEVSHAKTA